MRLSRLLSRIRRMGFEGPFYQGMLGKARFVFERLAWRTEFIFTGTRETLALARPPRPTRLSVAALASFAELGPFISQLEAEYYRGYPDSWRKPFTWGDQLVIGTIEGRIAAFAWVQRGTREGYPTYYSQLFERDARILRVGVVPSFRRQGVNSAMMRVLLERLLAEGFERVFAESHKYNVPSVRTFLKVGFRVVGTIRIIALPGGREFVRWSSADVEAQLRELDLAPDDLFLSEPAP